MPVIEIHEITPDPVFVHNLSRRALTKKHAKVTEKWLNDNNMEGVWSVNDLEIAGLANGAYAVAQGFDLVAVPLDTYGAYRCVFVRKLSIELFYRTLIYLPTDYKKGSCAYNDVLRHEMRHHVANAESIYQYIDKMRSDIGYIIREMEGDYIGGDQSQAKFDEVKAAMRDAVTVYLGDFMRQEMTRRNALIDTPEEYQRATLALAECKKKDGDGWLSFLKR